MSAAWSYVVGLPVVVTVGTDGLVSVEVDLCEADDVRLLSEGMPEEGYTEEQVEQDSDTIAAAVEAGYLLVRGSR